MTAPTSSGSACDYCGLPMGGPAHAAEEPVFCCFGCRFASGILRERDDDTTSRWILTRLGLSIFFAMNVMVFTMALWSNDVYGQDPGELSTTVHQLFRYLCLLMTLPVLGMLGIPLLHHAWQGLCRGCLSSELLIVAGVVAASAFSAVSVFRGHGHVYFEVACMVLVLVTLGRWMEATGRLKATAALENLQRLLPDSAARIRDGIEETIATDQLTIGDLIRIRAGGRFPTDGRIQSGRTTVDEQVFTGESVPVERALGDEVLAGTVNLDGDVVIDVTASVRDGSFSRLLSVLREARSGRGRYQRLADRIAQWFVPAVAVVAAVVFILHADRGLLPALMSSLAVVLIACPCALGLATPLAVWTALSHAAEHQVLFRNGSALEQLASVRAIRFDKTGTLTDGSPRVGKQFCDPATELQIMQSIAGRLSGASTHVFSRAIHDAVLTASGDFPQGHELVDIRTIPGLGVEATCRCSPGADFTVKLGSARFVDTESNVVPLPIREGLISADAAGNAIAMIAWEGRVRGLFLIDEQLRPESRSAIQACTEAGLNTSVLTGDRPERAVSWSEELKIPFAGGLSPGGKVEEIRRAQREIGPVAMVGDGINDAPALAASDVGIALGCGADITRDSGAVCIMSNDLRRVPWAFELSRQTRRIVRQNLAWAFGYNSVGIALAATGWLNPAIAAGLMVVSSVIVIVNSMRARISSAEIVSVQDGIVEEPASALMSESSQAPRLPTPVGALK